MLYLPAKLSASDALALFEPRKILGWPLDSTPRPEHLEACQRGGSLPHVELIFFPYHLIEFEVFKRKSQVTIWGLVDAWSGTFLLTEYNRGLLEGDPGAPAFPPKITAEEAVLSARNDLLVSIMWQRSGQATKPTPGGAKAIAQIHLPLWVYYYKRRRKFIDIRVLNALDGEIMGQRAKVGVLSAFAAAEGESLTALEKFPQD